MNIARSIRNNVVVGLLLVTPLVITGFIVNWLFTFTTNRLIRLIPREWLHTYPEVLFRAVSLIIVFVAFFFVGLFVRNMLGRRLFQLGDLVIGRIPFISKIYLSVRQISEALLDQSQTLFQEVALIEYPRKGVYSLGFVTSAVPAPFCPPAAGKDLVAVFIPTTPNPTSGWFAVVPRAELFILPMSTTDAMKLIVSGGAVFPGQADSLDQPTFFDKIEKWISRQGKPDGKTPRKDTAQA